MFASMLQAMTWNVFWMHVHRVNMKRRKRDSYPIILVFQLTYLQSSKAGTSQMSCMRGKQEIKKWIHAVQTRHTTVKYEWNHLEETCWDPIYTFLGLFTTGSPIVITVFEIKQLAGQSIPPKCRFNVYNSDVKSIAVICVYQGLKVPLVTASVLFEDPSKTINVGLEAVFHMQR